MITWLKSVNVFIRWWQVITCLLPSRIINGLYCDLTAVLGWGTCEFTNQNLVSLLHYHLKNLQQLLVISYNIYELNQQNNMLAKVFSGRLFLWMLRPEFHFSHPIIHCSRMLTHNFLPVTSDGINWNGSSSSSQPLVCSCLPITIQLSRIHRLHHFIRLISLSSPTDLISHHYQDSTGGLIWRYYSCTV